MNTLPDINATMVESFLEDFCFLHGHERPGEGSMACPSRWECAACLLEMLPRLREAIRATCPACRKGQRPDFSQDDQEYSGHPGYPRLCQALGLHRLSDRIQKRLRGVEEQP